MRYTIFGSTGRIGSFLKKYISSNGDDVYCPTRTDYYSYNRNLGHIIYCSGVTTDFKNRSFDLIQSVCLISSLKETSFDLNYISSSRLNFPKSQLLEKIHPEFYGDYKLTFTMLQN